MAPSALTPGDLMRRLEEPESVENPYPIYHAIRGQAPLAYVPYLHGDGQHWIVTRYDTADAILKDLRVWKDIRRLGAPEDSLLAHSMLFRDPPDHTRLRGLVNRAFTPVMVERLRPRIQDIVRELANRLTDAAEVDFMQAFAVPLPILVIADILGVPAEDRAKFRTWSNDIVGVSEEAGNEATKAMGQYFDALIRDKRQHPSDDLLSALMALEESGDRLSHAELLAMSVSAPCTVIGSPVLQPGQPVTVMIGAANRDPAQFPDPDRFDVSRTPNRHLAFGRGIPVYLGAPVARLEARIAWTEMLGRFPGLTWSGAFERRPNLMFRGLNRLMVACRA